MSITYESRTPYSDQSDAFSPPNEHISSPKQGVTPLINPSLHRDFFNAIQLRQDEVTLGTVTCIRPKYQHHKENLPDILESISNESLNKMLLENNNSQMIIIDVRSFGLYFQSRIKNAINLAVPSVLLKRASYTLSKVCDSVTMNMGERLRNWSDADSILFYGHTTTNRIQSRNSATAILVGSKLRAAGYKGHLYYLKGGFHAFHSEYPKQCDAYKINNTEGRKRRKPSMTLTLSTPFLNETSKAAVNPFFSNIRQNMELCHGPLKERFAIRLPSQTTRDKIFKTSTSQFSKWLHDVIEAEKGPKKLVEMYEQLERTEQQRLSLIMDFHSTNPDYDPSSKKFPFCITSNMEKGILNRYNNIWSYEYSRVKLKDSNRDDDFINGNYIAFEDVDDTKLSSLSLSDEQDKLVKKNLISKQSLYTMDKIEKGEPLTSNRWYIATQAPLPDTFNDFWKTVWNENSTIVVMLTREEEMNKIKCHRYWPTNPNETLKYGSINVTLLSEYKHPILNMNGKRTSHELEEITVRTFNLTTPKGHRRITHFQYTGWTDFGVPDHPLGLLQLVHLINQEKTVPSPLVVHCSAGCGRTGTFCVIDTVLQQLRYENDVSGDDKIWETIYRFREQRISMVQTHRQFVFCYEAIIWWMLGYGHSFLAGNNNNGSLCKNDT